LAEFPIGETLTWNHFVVYKRFFTFFLSIQKKFKMSKALRLEILSLFLQVQTFRHVPVYLILARLGISPIN